MIKFKGMKTGKNAERKSTQREQLPVGGYVAKILKAEVSNYSWGDVMVVSFDIADGEYKGFYKKDWEAQDGSQYGQKWGGSIRMNVPQENSKYYESEVTRFNNFIADVQDSNGEFEWDCDEAKLKGKRIGLLVREESGTTQDGNDWTKNKPFAFINAGDVEEGNFTMPKPYRYKNNNAAISTTPAVVEVDIDDDLPF